MSLKDISKREDMNIISNYMKIHYLNRLLKAATSLRVSSSWKRQAAANFDVSPNADLLFEVFINNACVLHNHNENIE